MLFNKTNVGFNASTMVNLTNESRTLSKGGCFRKDVSFHILAYAAIFFISLIGNSMTVYTISKRQLVKKNPHLFLLNMAIADLLVTVVYMPRMVLMMLYGSEWLVRGKLGLALCRVVPFLHHVSILVSVMSILGVTVDRFCAMMFPLKRILSLKLARIVIVTTWLFSGLVRVPYLIAPKINLRKYGAYVCDSNFKALFGRYRQVYINSLLSMYCILLLLTCVLYIVLISKLHRTKVPSESANESQARKRKASRKLLNMLLVITVCFILCWFVYFFAFAMFKRPLACSIRFIRFFLAHLNSAINPIVLAIFNDQYRDSYTQLFSKCFLSCKAVENKDTVKRGNCTSSV